MENIVTNFSGINIDFTGVCHGETLIYNKVLNNFSQTKIPFTLGGDMNKPNFIILSLGDELNKGVQSSVDLSNSFDLSNERIFKWDNDSNNWEIADLTKNNSQQQIAFHLSKRLIEAYDNIRPGIIEYSINNSTIVDWNTLNMKNDINVLLSGSLNSLQDNYKKINIILFSQGLNETTTSVENYLSNLLEFIEKIRELNYTNSKTPFITFELIGNDSLTNNLNNSLSYLNRNSDIYSRCVISENLGSIYFEENNESEIYKKYYSSETIRKLGTKAFREYKNMFKSS